MENEIREVIYIAISTILVALTLTFVSYINLVRGEMADVRMNEVQSAHSIEQYRLFNGYDAKEVIGEDVVELIRGQYDNIDIFVDYRQNASTGTSVDASHTEKCTHCIGNLDHRTYNYAQYLTHKDDADKNYFAVNTENITADSEADLRSWYPTDAKYRAFLVCNSADPEQTYNEIIAEYEATVGGTSDNLIKKQTIDRCAPPRTATDDITAIILISYDTLHITD